MSKVVIGNTANPRATSSKASKSEHEIQTEILLEFGAKPWCRIWRCNTGKAYGFGQVSDVRELAKVGRIDEAIRRLKGMALTTYGTPGAADIQGIIQMPTRFFLQRGLVPMALGRFFAIEVKRPGESIKPDSDQDKWRRMVISHGGLHIEAHSVEDVRQALQKEGYDV